MDKYSFLGNGDTAAIDNLYDSYKQDPESIDSSWKDFFKGFDFSLAKYGENKAVSGGISEKEVKVYSLIRAYRSRAHLIANTNPVRQRKDRQPYIDLKDFGLTDADLNTRFVSGNEIGLTNATLKEIVDALKKIYAGTIGFGYMYIRQPEIQDWFKQKIEKEMLAFDPSKEVKKRILHKLNEAVVFENFLHTKYVGQKRFSLEGGENTIAGLDTIINTSSDLGVEEIMIGMAHRGRLNVLCNTMGKTYEQIFNEFEGNTSPDLTMGDGDVKYHMGYSSEITTQSGKKITLKLSPNPSHLEAVDPVVLGYIRAQIDDEYEGDMSKAMAILIHGDAAIAGQGIVYETVQMAALEGYKTGGTIHFVINNQVGFTTDFEDARTSIYCTDVAKIIDAPVIHVNGDDAEAVNFVCRIASEYRQKFGKDIFIDMVCYRRHGHNESDEPKFTQPKLYNIIAKHPNPREVYKKILVERGDFDAQIAEDMEMKFRDLLQDRLNLVKEKPLPYAPQKKEIEWENFKKATPEDFKKSPETGIKLELIDKIAKALTTFPDGFKPLKQVDNLFKERQKMFFETKSLNWAAGELLAYGSILSENKIVRLSGQDVKRGTFSHRHAVIFDSETNESYCNIDHIDADQEKIRIYNSLLSEFGVLGFEYGYAMASPNALTIWEGQFGDFCNGAQTIIDQFIASAESKWQKQNGLVMLLPHGYEGQGPEHSSARMERFLQLCAEYNMIVTNITKPSNLFHFMRRQLAWDFRKPAVVMSPKSLLRNPLCVSPIEEFTQGCFQELIDDENAKAGEVKKVLFCSGKIYYELLGEQLTNKRKDIAIVRLEQVYPLPTDQINKVIEKYKGAKLAWVQEEPENMGSWSFILRTLRHLPFDVHCRKNSASPATGYAKVHAKEQAEIISKAFTI